jgi:hypothetical protein
LGGVAFRANGTSGARNITQTRGALDHSDGKVTLIDGTYTFTASDDDANGEFSDGAATARIDTTRLSDDYTYMRAYDLIYTASGVTYDTYGIYGIVTQASDMPIAGTANFIGEATGLVAAGTDGYDLTDGTSTVAVNFRTNAVTVTLSDFTSRNQTTGAAGGAPLDTITASGMTINGNRFTNGTITTRNNGSVANLTGDGTSTTAQGIFYGYDDNNAAPAETAGIILIEGDDGLIYGTFMAK